MIYRKAEKEIKNLLGVFPVVGILGPRQVGKTTIAKSIQQSSPKNVVYLDLELPSDINKLHDPELYLAQHSQSLVIIDEVQRMPHLFPVLRALVDKNRAAGRFLILGSASPDMIKQSSESLAGRVIYQELTPFSLNEIGYDNVHRLWLRGGYPNSYLSQDDDISFRWREAFIKTYLEMDLPQLGIRIPSMLIRRFWTMLAHYNGQIWNASQIAVSLGISAPTVRNYLGILEETFIARSLQPYYANTKKRLVKSPKVYIRDTGLLHALLRNKDIEALQGHPSVGNSWEGFVIEQILALIPQEWQAFYYQTGAGAEIDLLIFDENNRPIAIEVKYSAAPKVTKGFWSALEDMGSPRGFVIYPGQEIYPLSRHNVWALPVSKLDDILH